MVAGKAALELDLTQPDQSCACPGCGTTRLTTKLRCDDCYHLRMARLGCITIDAYPRRLHIAEEGKKIALKTLDARGDIHTPWFHMEMQTFNYIHKDISRSPTFRHITPVYEVRGQATGYHAWEFKVLSGECTSALFGPVFRACDENDSLKLLAHGGAIAIVPSSIFLRIKAKDYYRRPFSSLPLVRLTLDTVAIVPSSNGSSAEWRWPDGVEYDDDSIAAIKRYMSSLLRELVVRGQPVHQHVLTEIARWR